MFYGVRLVGYFGVIGYGWWRWWWKLFGDVDSGWDYWIIKLGFGGDIIGWGLKIGGGFGDWG